MSKFAYASLACNLNYENWFPAEVVLMSVVVNWHWTADVVVLAKCKGPLSLPHAEQTITLDVMVTGIYT